MILYTTGTINQPDAGSVGLAMAEKIRDDVVAHAAWDLVEEFTAASGTVRWYVFKCLAAQSGLPYDFYVVMSRLLSNGELRIWCCETYNPASHTANHYAPGGYSNTYAYDASGRYTADYILGTTAPVAGGSAPAYSSWTPGGTSTKWWITVAEDGFTVAFNGPSNGYFHVGAYTPLTQLPILFPIQTSGSSAFTGGSGLDSGGITRNPAVANISFYGAALVFQPATWLGFSADWRYNDKLQGNQRSAGELGITIYRYQPGDDAISGYALGKQKRLRGTYGTVPPALAFGDAYVLQGRLWVPYKPDNSRIWDTGVASS